MNFTNSVLRYPNSQTVHTDENQLSTQSLSLLLEFSQMIFFKDFLNDEGQHPKILHRPEKRKACINSDLMSGERNTGHLIIS